jgi:hypothetical protein
MVEVTNIQIAMRDGEGIASISHFASVRCDLVCGVRKFASHILVVMKQNSDEEGRRKE